MISRRKFISHSCALGAATTTLSSTLLQLGLARAAAAQNAPGYRALVCVLLAGGNDSYNMLLPNDADQLDEYRSLRADLALDAATLLPLAGTAPDGRRHALHGGMPEVQALYDAGELALIANVGTLVDAFDGPAIAAGNARLPLGLFSHSDQIAQWQTGVPDARVAQGWGGRLADLVQGPSPVNGISMNISLSGTNVFQSGRQAVSYSVSADGNGAAQLGSYADPTPFGMARKQMIDALLAPSRRHIFRREYATRLRNAIDSNRTFVDALAMAPDLTSPFSDNLFSASLRQIARIIGARDFLGATRQTFFVTVGGWDHHDELLGNQARLLPMISRGLQEFRDALIAIDAFDAVTTFTISDFGRTLTSNGRGSDHGWGGHHMVMGGAVRGGNIYGQYPQLSANSALDVGRGIYAPTTAVDEYFADLALWLGVAGSDLDAVLPNVRRFYDPASAAAPLGLFDSG